MLPQQTRVDLGAMATKEYSAFPKAPSSGASASDFFVSYAGHSLGETYRSAEIQLMYYTDPADLDCKI